MCSVVGVVDSIDEDLHAAGSFASDRLVHGGPEANGIANDPSAILGHRWLASVDLSSVGRKPMEDADTGNVLCYKGELYNDREPRRFQPRIRTQVLGDAALVGPGLGFLEGQEPGFVLLRWDRCHRVLL